MLADVYACAAVSKMLESLTESRLVPYLADFSPCGMFQRRHPIRKVYEFAQVSISRANTIAILAKVKRREGISTPR